MKTLDKTIRISTALVLTILVITGIADGALAIIFLALATVFILTGMIGFCPLYTPSDQNNSKDDLYLKEEFNTTEETKL